MDLMTAVAISVGIFSGIWAFVSDALGLIVWVGFIGFTSYFASGTKVAGLKRSILANISGIVWAMCTILGTKYLPGSYWSYILTGFFSFVMCFQAKARPLEFIPGAFLGACSTFATGGNWIAVIISLIFGNVFGHISNVLGLLLKEKIKKDK